MVARGGESGTTVASPPRPGVCPAQYELQSQIVRGAGRKKPGRELSEEPQMKKPFTVAVAAFALGVVLAFGCQQPVSPTTAPKEKETNIHIDTPGVKVDVKGKGGDKGKVDVDVNRKDR